MTGVLAALHESAIGTKLPIPNVRSSVANGGKADNICSMRVLRILTQSSHWQVKFAAMHFAVWSDVILSLRVAAFAFKQESDTYRPEENPSRHGMAPPAHDGFRQIPYGHTSRDSPSLSRWCRAGWRISCDASLRELHIPLAVVPVQTLARRVHSNVVDEIRFRFGPRD